MGLNPARPDLVGRLRRSSEQMRQERIRPRGHTESKTFIVLGDLSDATFVPPFIVGINHDDETPEWKRLIGFAAILQSGSVSLQWRLNGVVVAAHSAVGTTTDVVDLTPPLDLAHGDAIQIEIVSASSAVGLSAVAFMVTAPG